MRQLINDTSRRSENPSLMRRNSLNLFKLLSIVGFILVANFGIFSRIGLLLDQGRFVTLVPFLIIWAIAIFAVLVAAFQPNVFLRGIWAIVIAASSAMSWAFYDLSHSEMSVFDILSLWNARHEAGRAAEFYEQHLVSALIVLALGFLVIFLPPRVTGRAKNWLRRLCWFPLVPIALIAAVVFAKDGGGSDAMPWQFRPAALSSLAGIKIAFLGTTSREPVKWVPTKEHKSGNIVMLVDESVRADYIDLSPGNRFTPQFAGLADKFVNFGPAASTGNCSSYSNVLLRYGVSRQDITGDANTNPSLWEYAKRSGYRTVFIDAQAGNISNPGLMQNFMTMREKSQIDGFYAVRGVPGAEADGRLADIITKELTAPGPVFIYANKNGAHFPYDHAYPSDAAVFHPTMTESGIDNTRSRIASYRNAISWSVDRFMGKVFANADLSNTTLVYTSDHGQVFQPDRLTHCNVESPDPRVGLVPLMVHTSDLSLQALFQNGAKQLTGKTSQFQIAPTLLQLMGYRPDDIATAYDESLLTGSKRAPAFTSGDVFGLFSSGVRATPIDLSIDYLEPEAREANPAVVAAKK
ncbi:MAG TPA: sulfatase-like hydrolase/transferase [Aestuariivirga sp.]|nr:sulfatase-like hydrolase/transferase [Aestuariivirga sp.]